MNYILIYLIYLFFGVLPSLVWLSFYLEKDKHPEPKILLSKIFVLGALITIPTTATQKLVLNQIKTSYFDTALSFLAISLLLMAFLEELFKFLVVKFGALKSSEFDEPVDAMIYMVTAALGFAAAENFLVLLYSENEDLMNNFFKLPKTFIIWENVFQISFVRFIGATFLHALCGAIIGFAIALAFKNKNREKFVIPSLIIASILHALYNFSIIKVEEGWSFAIPFILLIVLYSLISLFFEIIKNEQKT